MTSDILTFHYLLSLYKYILVLFFIVRKMLLTLRYNISNLNCLQDIYIKNNFKLFQNIQKPAKNQITKMLFGNHTALSVHWILECEVSRIL